MRSQLFTSLSVFLLGVMALLPAVTPALADLSVTIGYETRPLGEIDPCG